MTDTPTPARRIRTPGWRDPRLIVGLVLVVLSVAGVVTLVQAADARQGYWAASGDIVPGAKVQADDFHVVQANLSDAAPNYWLAEEQLPAEFYVSATILPGEFLTKRQVTTADADGRQQVGVRVSEDMPASVTTGSRTDVWVSLADPDGRGFEAPTRLINNAEVVGTAEQSSAFASADTVTVYLMVAQDALPEVLDAQANGAKISLVPATAGE